VPDEPSVVEVEARRLLAVQRRIAWNRIGEVAMPALDQVWASIRGRGIEGFGHNVFLYTNTGRDGADAGFGVEVPPSVEPADGLVIMETPAGQAATLTHWGSYDGLRAANQRLLAWCDEHQHQLSGVSWEVYGDWSDDPAKLRTDIFYRLTTSS
jgi:effector-binding domain-containing protein